MQHAVYQPGALLPMDDKEEKVRVLPIAIEFFMPWSVLRLAQKGGERFGRLTAGSHTGALLRR